jgi:hypothetical protein
VEQHAPLLANLADGGERLQDANFIIREHDADENRLIRERFRDLPGSDASDRSTGRKVTSKPSRCSRRHGSRTA